MMMMIACLTDDHSRVKLSIIDGDPNSDYINACYISVSIQSRVSQSLSVPASH